MRFKVMHKIYDSPALRETHMCVGCGRCDERCPKDIVFSDIINTLRARWSSLKRKEEQADEKRTDAHAA